MGDLGQSLPPDTGTKLANLELGAEQAVASLGEAEQEHKRARTVRYDFQVTQIIFAYCHFEVNWRFCQSKPLVKVKLEFKQSQTE